MTLANTDIKRPVAAATLALAGDTDSTYAVLLADGVVSLASNAGATLRAVNGATRATLVTYGSLPISPDGVVAGITGDRLQYGHPGLFTYIGTASGDGDLYFFKCDAAGLIRVTNFIPAASAQAVRVGALGVSMLPMTRDKFVR